jgi:hypothetical protein
MVVVNLTMSGSHLLFSSDPNNPHLFDCHVQQMADPVVFAAAPGTMLCPQLLLLLALIR